MSTSLLVYNGQNESDQTFVVGGKEYVFSSRKDNRLMFVDSAIADKFVAEYGKPFVIHASYDGPRGMTDRPGTIKEVAAVMVNRKTPEETRRAYETFRQFYPFVRMYLIDNGSNDESAEYIKSLAVENTTTIFNPYNYGHGQALHQAAGMLRQDGYRFMFALDSDTETTRGGFIELMLDRIGGGYAIGKSYQKCESGFVNNSRRGVTYIHPAAAIYNLNFYSTLRPFVLHGAPCIDNMIDANLHGLGLVDFPIYDYVHHYGTGTVGKMKPTDVNGAYIFAQRPPLISFIVQYGYDLTQLFWCIDSINAQTNPDYEIVLIKYEDHQSYSPQRIVTKARGLYMVVLDEIDRIISEDFVSTIQETARDNLYPNIIVYQSIGADEHAVPTHNPLRDEPICMQLDIHNLAVRRELWMTDAINYGGRWDDFETIKDLFDRKEWPSFYWLDRVMVKLG